MFNRKLSLLQVYASCVNNLAKRSLLQRTKERSVFQDVIQTTLETSKIHSLNDWKNVRKAILEHVYNRGQYHKDNIDALIIGYCANTKNCDLGTSYLNFLNKENIKPNLATVGKYLKLLYAINEEIVFKQGKHCPKIEEELILRYYKDLRNEYPILDSFSLENSILALSLTSQWKMCLSLLDDIKLTTVPNNSSYSAVASAAFLNKDEELAWRLLEEIMINNRTPNSIVFLSYLSTIKKLQTRDLVINKIEKLFSFLQYHDLNLPESVVRPITELAKQFEFETKLTSISFKGICYNCNKKLHNFLLSNSEFEELKSAIVENVIVGRDIFNKSNPEELKRFEDFVKTMGKHDVVLDGLNIAYSIGTKQSPYVFSGLLAEVVSYFVKRKKRVLVLGRQHMTRWPWKNWGYVTENASIFLTQNISQDDPYLLYCGLHSGKDTIIVTRDLMRGHRFLLNNYKHRLWFSRWLSQRVTQLVRVDNTRGPIFRIPQPFGTIAQKNDEIWHIPYDMDIPKNRNEKYEFHKAWLCLKC